jgi:cytochrome c biogenesis protein CcdA/glutaredoxin
MHGRFAGVSGAHRTRLAGSEDTMMVGWYGARAALVAVAALLTAAAIETACAQQPPSGRVPDLVVFSHVSCPYCQEARRYLAELQRRQPDLIIVIRELSEEPAAARDLQTLARAQGIPSAGVPAFHIGGRIFQVGFDRRTTPGEIEAALKRLNLPPPRGAAALGPTGGDSAAADPGAGAGTTSAALPSCSADSTAETVGDTLAAAGGCGGADLEAREERTVRLPLVGEIGTASVALPAMTALIAFVDGFNPCSLWVLTFLLGIVIYTGSRRKIAIVGFTFLAVTTAAYGVFMLGLFTTLHLLSYMGWVTTAVAAVALAFALINIKDYFWFRQGISLTISDRHKPGIYARVRGLMHPGRSLPALVAGTAVLALGITLVELPCTAGFPMVWSGIVAARDVSLGYFAALFTLYLSIYLLDELIVFGIAVITLRRSRLEEKHGRALKLVGGMVMLSLAVTLLLAPQVMHSLAGTFLVFGGAAAASALVLLVHRRVLPRYGIVIGTERL